MVRPFANNFTFLGVTFIWPEVQKKYLRLQQQPFVYVSDWKSGTYKTWCTYVEATLSNMSGKVL